MLLYLSLQFMLSGAEEEYDKGAYLTSLISKIARKGLDAAAHDQQSMKGLVCKLYMFTIFFLQLITSLDIWIVIYLATGKFEIGLLWSQLFSIRSHRAM
ncbi:hypothetical protein HanXRQr2_Chr03g0111081 [Helianthus annuus]|uniref:Uncharacterized protein n=1 Tax=Helianthus annuus TaxID=4232 RepID=A0A9K3JGC7_HELAN|nr:hypothetical protein HanXRQr2_Chr03g0111081 [Helianthus annuus]KAJ0943687.1 hypothetical protein HanPSC8_Chr03g0107591 [Helianthus annuus]